MALPKATSFQDLRSVHFSAFLFFTAQVCWDSIIPSFDWTRCIHGTYRMCQLYPCPNFWWLMNLYFKNYHAVRIHRILNPKFKEISPGVFKVESPVQIQHQAPIIRVSDIFILASLFFNTIWIRIFFKRFFF